MSSVAVVDSGTSSTRVRVVRGDSVIHSVRDNVGARDTVANGHDGRLRAALKAMLADATTAEPELRAAVFSGMITSNVGLIEVPHLVAPVSPDELARGLVRHDFPDITPLPCYFVPGVRTPSNDHVLAGLDVLRGEEVEVLGLRRLLSMTSDAIFMHYGSHHKAIDVDAHGRILASRTSLTGELLVTLSEHTILSNSLTALEDLVIDGEAWRHGLADAQQHGTGRALFLVRVGEQIGGYSKAYMTSYLLGVLSALDLSLLNGSVLNRHAAPALVLYGRGPFKHALAAHLETRCSADLHVVEDDIAEAAAAVGAAELAQQIIELGQERV